MTTEQPIQGQLNAAERKILTEAITKAAKRPGVVIEVGTWLGGGSTLHILRALEQNGEGHLWGVEADRTIYERMLANIRAAVPEASGRFTPMFGFSQDILPNWIKERGPELKVDLTFLDGGDNPLEQVTEFQLLDPYIPVGGQLMGHDAKLRKGKWLAPYMRAMDNWKVQVHDISDEGLLTAVKVADAPSPASREAAARVLSKLRRSPVEVLGALLPARLNAMILRVLPRSLARRIAEGRR
jgi:predicted O-methyltransferase YrrM